LFSLAHNQLRFRSTDCHRGVYSLTMSRTFSIKNGSVESLKDIER
jgi:hypothetical protein